ncbi:hypothetical protein ACL03H_15440 [Saccharopolyspora sp. MS10]|uniref:hypothetical protein n=1 Tax=Saccharopolyspora sp. MS10 TaxID=3385973 RepID=UPI0039A02FE6
MTDRGGILNAEASRSVTDVSGPMIIAIGARVSGVSLLDIVRNAVAASTLVATAREARPALRPRRQRVRTPRAIRPPRRT